MNEFLAILLVVGGGWWWLSSRRRPPSPTDAAAPPIVHGDGKTNLEVAGLQHHRETMDQLFSAALKTARRSADEVEPGDFESIEVAATLRLTSDNAHDDQAVEVLLTGALVGHLSRAMARAFREYIKRQRLNGTVFRCPAQVDLPLHPDDDYTVSLDLPLLLPKQSTHRNG